MKIKFSKMHGLGNDFIILNNIDLSLELTTEIIQKLSDRKFGIGCDQLLVVEPASDGQSDFFYRIYNSDGSEAGQCGNGARCFISFLHLQGLSNKSKVKLQTNTRVIDGQIINPSVVEVNMGNPDFKPENIPLNLFEASNYEFKFDNQLIQFTAASMGNPHAVIRIATPEILVDNEYLTKIGSMLQQSPIFPESVNVNFMFVENEGQLRLCTYERGSGLTLACGSGACATAAVAVRDGLVRQKVKVIMPGGELEINWTDAGLLMTGEAIHVFDGEIEI
ncbi:diaminopimelate epimerase [Aquella oligotrophica]|uniref:Diaminopimelate epimerase n=1 Tax=Aquella oligotrophica TaxID=2067065 RepID=A0A2I7N3Q6_9NEIS|nr:diaminopimelate epimerase [Aquella oligotrophica]AUR51096.1 diaminopimelate epimerase [Aquella oligotrophica]